MTSLESGWISFETGQSIAPLTRNRHERLTAAQPRWDPGADTIGVTIPFRGPAPSRTTAG